MKKDASPFMTKNTNVFKQILELTQKEGQEGWTLAKETLLKRKRGNPLLQEAIEYTMNRYAPDYFRPAFVSLCCRAVGGKPSSSTVIAGASMVLLARALGFHDDIIDDSKTKKGRPTLFGKYGKNLTLVLSDCLMFEGFTLLRGIRKEQNINSILETIEGLWSFEQSESETLELQHRNRTDITPEECVKKIKMRSSEIEAIARIGGILGNGKPEEIDMLGEYGRHLGFMAILRDELVDMFELDELKHRIKKESLPLPVVYALQNSEARPQLLRTIQETKLSSRDLIKIAQLCDEVNSIETVANLIRRSSIEASSLANRMVEEKQNLQLLSKSAVVEPEEWKPIGLA